MDDLRNRRAGPTHPQAEGGPRDLRRRRRPPGHRIPPPSTSPIPPYPGPVIELQGEITRTVEQQSIIVGAQNNPIRIIYGRTIVGADVSAVEKNQADLVIRCTWGEGECDAIERYWVNGADPVSGMVANHYLGTPGQGIDPLLKNACIASGRPAYTDTLPGICYSVFHIPPGTCAGFPQVTALIRGRKVSTSSGGAKVYSENPAYCIADFIENATFGMNRAVDWTSVATVAAACDEMIGSPSEKRHVFSLVISDLQPVDNWLAVMRDYAGCWVVPEGPGYRLVLDSTGPVGSVKTITGISKANPMRVTSATVHAANSIVKIEGINSGMVEANGIVAVVRSVDSTHVDLAGVNSTSFSTWTAGGTLTQIGTSVYSFNASNIVAGTWRAQKAGAMNAPTVVEVDYTNTTSYPWRTDTTDSVFVPGVYDIVPTVPFRRTRVSKPGLNRYSEAHRYAVELVNAGQLNDLTVEFQAFDIALKLQVGDLVDVTHPSGLSSKIMRLVRAEPVSPGRWDIMATEHDDAKYSQVVVTGPTPGDTIFDSPLSPPTVAGLSVAELVIQNASGAWVSQLAITWTDASPPAGTYPFVLNYRVDICDGATLVETATVQRSGDAAVPPKYVSGALPENVAYTVKVTTISTLLAESPPASAVFTNSGKSAKPSDVVSIDAYEVGGEVRIQIDPATDLDLTAHEYRYGDPGTSTWATAMLLDRVATPSVRYSTRIIPAGSWRIYVKGLDSVRTPAYPWGQESVNAKWKDIEVSSDASAFVAVDYDYTTPGLYKMTQGMLGGTPYWISDSGATWNATLTSNINSYAVPLLTRFNPARSALVTEVKDHLANVTGDWFASVDRADLTGASNAFLELNNTGPEGSKTITGATSATPIVITTSAAHNYSNGDEVEQSGFSTNTLANGRFIVANVGGGGTTYELTDFAGNNVGPGNGSVTGTPIAKRWTWFAYSSLTAKTTARYSRLRLATTGVMKVNSLGHVRANVVARHEGGQVTTLSGTAPAVVTFTNAYNKAITAGAWPVGAAVGALTDTCAVDMIEVSGGRGVVQSGANYLLRFNGTSDYVAVGDNAAFEFGGGADTAFSIEFWLKMASIGAAQCVISKGNNTTLTGSYEVRVGAAGKLQFILIDSTASASVNCATSTLLVPDLWYHVACTYSGSSPTTAGNMKVYLNGVPDVTTLILTGTYTRMRDTAVALEFGRHADSTNWLGGRLDEVRIWNVERSAAQITANMNAALTSGTGLVGRWGFDEGSGTTAVDSVAARNGTLTGGPPKYRPYNGMDVYRFKTDGTQVADLAAWSFDGV